MYVEEANTKKNLWICFLGAIAVITIPVLALSVPVRPVGEEIGVWFQGSGSIMTVLCLVLELKLFSIHGVLFPSGYVSVGFDEFKEKYLPFYKALSVSILILTAVGTIIWGYGDLMLTYNNAMHATSA